MVIFVGVVEVVVDSGVVAARREAEGIGFNLTSRRPEAYSRLVRELRAEVSEEPETIHQQDFSGTHSAESGEVQRVRREEMEQREYEESNFTRLQLSKEAKREQRRRVSRV